MRNRNEWVSSESFHSRVALPHNGYATGVNARVVPGAIVVVNREPWRVLEVNERPEDLWPERYETVWQKLVTQWVEHEAARLAGEPESWGEPRKARPQPVRAEWWNRPIVLVLQPVDDPKAKLRHLCCGASMDLQVLPEHYSVCRLCQELPPCRHEEMEKTVDQAMAVSDRLMAIPRGACLGCGETISSRMKAVRFPGPNLWRPDWGTDSAVFHARARDECSNGVWRYEKQWKTQGLDALNPHLTEEA